MADLLVRFKVDTSQYEAGMAKIRQLTDSTVSNIGDQANASAAGIRALGDAAAKSLAGFQEASKASAAIRALGTEAHAALNEVGRGFTQVDPAIRNFVRQFEGLSATQQAFKLSAVEVGRGLGALSEAGGAAREAIEKIGSSLTKVSLALTAFGTTLTVPFFLGVRAAADFEQAMSGVRRTLGVMGDASEEAEANFQDIAKGLRDISADSGMAVQGIAAIAAEAGRLGLRGTDDILKFTDSVQKVSQITGMTAQEVARQMGTLARAMDFPITEMDRLGSAVVAIGAAAQASDGQILNMSQMLAANARQAGFSTEQLLALAGAIASTGAGSERAAFAFNILLQRMTESVQEGDGFLELFAKVSGLIDATVKSSEDFAKVFRADAFRAVSLFLEGLAVTGDRANGILSDLGVGGARAAQSFLRMAQQAGLLEQMLGKTNATIRDTTELNKQYANVQDDLNDIIKSLATTIDVALGEAYAHALPWIKAGAEAIRATINWAREHPIFLTMAANVATLTGAFSLLAGALGFTARGALSVVSELGTITDAVISLTTSVDGKASILKRLFSTLSEGAVSFSRSIGFAVAGVISFVGALGAGPGGGGLSLAFAGLNAALGPTGWVILGLTALAAGLAVVEAKTGLVSKSFGELTTVLGEVTTGLYAVATEDVWSVISDAAHTAVQIIKDDFATLKSFLPQSVVDAAKGIVAAMAENLPAIKASSQSWWDVFIPGADFLRERGQQFEAEAKAQAAIARAIAADAAPKVAAAFDVMYGDPGAAAAAKPGAKKPDLDKLLGPTDTQVKQAQQRAKDIMAVFQNQSVMAQAQMRLALEQGEISEEQVFDGQLEQLAKRRAAIEEQYNESLSGIKAGKDSAGQRQDLKRAFTADMESIKAAVLDVETQQIKLARQRAAEVGRSYTEQAEMYTQAYGGLLSLAQQLDEELTNLGRTPEQRQLQGLLDDYNKKLEEIAAAQAHYLPGEAAYTQAIENQAKAQRNLNASIDAFFQGPIRQGDSQVRDLAVQLGVMTEAEYRAAIGYDAMDAAQKRWIDRKLETIGYAEALADALAQVRTAADLMAAGVDRAQAQADAALAQGIQKAEGYRDARIRVAETIVNEEQRRSQQEARIQQLDAQRYGKVFDFMGATARRWAAEQQTIFQGLETMAVNTFSNMGRTLSDVFFSLFTGETVKLKDVWKQMLNAMLRELANFLASATVKFFIQFLGNLMGGQGVGQSAGGAFGSLFAGSNSGSGSGGDTTSNILGLASTGLGALGKLLSGSGSTPTTTSGSGSTPAFTLGANTQLQSPLANFTMPSSSGGGLGFTDFTFSSSGFGLIDALAYEPSFDFGGTQTGGFYMASGGPVPGIGTGDTVPAMLTPGEFVVRREVAQELRPLLTALNNGGAPSAHNGRLYFADGGVVPTITGDQAIVNLLYAIYQQTAIQTGAVQATAANTGATAVALGEQAASTSANITTLTGVGGNVQAGTAPAGTSGGGGGTGGGGGGTVGPSQIESILRLLGSGTGLLKTSTGLITGLTNTASSPFARTLNTSLGVLGGGINLASGIASGNITQSIGGGLSLLGAGASLPVVQQFLNTQFGSQVIGSGATAIGAGQLTSSTLGILGGALGVGTSVAQMVESGASAPGVLQALLSAYQIYSASAPIFSAAGIQIPTLTTFATSLLEGGTVGAALGLTGPTLSAAVAAGVPAAELAAIGVTGVELAAAGVGTGAAAVAGPVAATTLSGALSGLAGVLAPVAIVMAIKGIVDIIHMIQAKNEFDDQKFNVTNKLRTVIPQIIENVPKVADQVFATVNDPNATPQQLRAAYDSAESWTALYNEWDSYFKPNGGYGLAPPELVKIGEQLAPFLQALRFGQIRAVDRLAIAAPGLVPVGVNALSFADLVGVNAKGALRPSSLTGTDMSSIGANWTQGALPSAGLTWTASGFQTTSIHNQLGALQPGSFEQGLFGAAQAYGTVDPTLSFLGFGTSGTLAGGAFQPVSQASIDQARATAEHLRQIQLQVTAMEQAWFESQMAVSPGGLQTGGWVPGRGYGDHVPMLLEPGEFVVPRPIAQHMGTRLHNLLGEGAAAQVQPTTMPITINITVHGNVDDPHEMAERLAPILRDQLRRIDTRYSRAGNKSQV